MQPVYDNLADIVADNGYLEALLNDENAIDYLARCTGWAASVPIMTSNDSPEGEAIGHSFGTDAFYRAFDGNNSTSLGSTSDDAINIRFWAGYHFPNPVCINKVYLYNAGGVSGAVYKIQASNNGTDWVDLASYTSAGAGETKTIILSNTNEYEMYRWYLASSPSKFWWGIGTLQFYSSYITDSLEAMTLIGQNDYAADALLSNAIWNNAICNSIYIESVLTATVPTMTSNTTPSGIVAASGIWGSGWEAWRAFNNSYGAWGASTMASSGQTSPSGWIQYKFDTSNYIIKAMFLRVSSGTTNSYTISGSNDNGSTFTTIRTGTTIINDTYVPLNTNTTNYQVIRLTLTVYNDTGSDKASPAVAKLQFYGRQDV